MVRARAFCGLRLTRCAPSQTQTISRQPQQEMEGTPPDTRALPTSTAAQVSYQTAFWTLVPLATCVMTQPSGRVLGSPSRYRTYLRSSPIFCAVDALSFLIKLAFSPFLPGASISRAIAEIICHRYGDVDDEAEGIQSLEKMTALRWVFFLVGTLGPAVKMAAMGGIP